MYKNNFLVHVKCDKKLLKENDDCTVTIPFDRHYSIVMKNMDSRKCVTSITIDGKSIGNDLILNGNQLVNLKRFTDNINSGNKFKFVKKESENNKSSDIDKGFIRVEVKWEKPTQSYEYMFPTDILRGKLSSLNHDYNVSYNSMNCSSEPLTKTCTLDSDSQPQVNSNVSFDKLEEGITVKGKKCNQKFEFGKIGELENSSTVFVFKLMGYSKPTREEINEFYSHF
jgi:hypothetical protein